MPNHSLVHSEVVLIKALLFLCFLSLPAQASNGSISWLSMSMELLGGLALFLFGMERMAEGLKAAAGDRMRTILGKLTGNRVMGALTGAFTTAIIQSSSVTTVLVVGFISAGIMTLPQSVGVIMGANIGTTITAQIVAFKVTKLAFAMIAVGYGLCFLAKGERPRQYGSIVMGLGLVFFGMSIMSNAMEPLRSYQPFLDLMMHMENPIMGIIVAALFTALVQSSSATTGIVIVMASQGLISLSAGIILAFGSNVGTCVTALLASIGKPREALRAATVHILFNLIGVVLWVFFIDELASLVTGLSPQHTELSGLARLAAETPRQIANAHTIFNVANTVFFIGFSTQLAHLAERLVPDRKMNKQEKVKPRFLDDLLLSTPSLALSRARHELGHMGDYVIRMLTVIEGAMLEGQKQNLISIAKADDKVDYLYRRIVDYLGKISAKGLGNRESQELLQLMEAANDLEHIGDLVEMDLVSAGLVRIENNLTISQETENVISRIHARVCEALVLAIESLVEADEEKANKVIGMKSQINDAVESASVYLAGRLVADAPNRMTAYSIEMSIVEKLKRIYYYAKRVAKKATLEQEDT